jgi:hypothetical protein
LTAGVKKSGIAIARHKQMSHSSAFAAIQFVTV